MPTLKPLTLVNELIRTANADPNALPKLTIRHTPRRISPCQRSRKVLRRTPRRLLSVKPKLRLIPRRYPNPRIARLEPDEVRKGLSRVHDSHPTTW